MGLRNADLNDRAFSRGAAYGEITSQQKSPLAHAQNPQRPSCCELLVHSPAVIANFKDNAVTLLTEADINLGRLGVPGDVSQSFLKNSENRSGALLIDDQIFPRQVQPQPGPRASREFLGRPLDGSHQTKVIKDSRPKFGRDAAHGSPAQA